MGLRRRKRLLFSPKARIAIQDIYEYVRRTGSVSSANYVRKALIAKCRSLLDFSGFSVERYLEGMEWEFRSVTQWDYNIIYFVADDHIEIIDIIHTSRHPDKRKDFLP